MKNILLVSEDTVKTYSNINSNVWGKFLLPAIRESQEMGLMPIIGECLYNRICDLVGNDLIGDDMYVQYKDLLDDYIEPYLIYQTLTNVTPLINGKMGNIGTVSTNDEHIINLSQGELDLVQNYYRERADFYQIRLQNWVKANASAFPELECSCENMQPNLDRANNSVGLWLGGVRGKRMAQKCACGGEQKSQGGDYAQGYADGYASGRTAQKALITSLTVSENGTYENENGYNPVVVDVAGGTLQEKDVNLPYDVSGITITPDSGFYGLSSVTVDATWALDNKYNEGFNEGVRDTKDKMEDIFIDHNGTFSSPSGYDIVTVNVPQTGGSVTLTGGSLTVSQNTETATPSAGTAWTAITVDATTWGNERFVEGQNYYASSCTSTALTQNGTFTPSQYAWSSVTVNVPQTGGSCNLQEKSEEIPIGDSNITVYPDAGYDGMSAVTVGAKDAILAAENEGYTSGYTDGFSDGSNYGEEIVIQSSVTLSDYGRYYFDYTEFTSISSMTINFANYTPTPPTPISGHKLLTVTYTNGPQYFSGELYNDMNAGDLTGVSVDGSEVFGRLYEGYVETVEYYFANGGIPAGFFERINLGDKAEIHSYCVSIGQSAFSETSLTEIKVHFNGHTMSLGEGAISNNLNLQKLSFVGLYGTLQLDYYTFASITNNNMLNELHFTCDEIRGGHGDEFYGSNMSGTIYAGSHLNIGSTDWYNNNLSGWIIDDI